jgi:hypothetical protein
MALGCSFLPQRGKEAEGAENFCAPDLVGRNPFFALRATKDLSDA